MDRNRKLLHPSCTAKVALRKESVDRNFCVVLLNYKEVVALRKESVDRNVLALVFCVGFSSSLSARRAWIEITWLFIPPTPTSRRSPQGERG